MGDLIAELAGTYDMVIIDSPPVLAVTDALLAGVHTDGIMLIARMRSTTRSALRRAIDAVERVDARLLGIVVNAATETEDKRYGYGQGYVSQDKSNQGADIRPVVGGMVANGRAHMVPSPPSPAATAARSAASSGSRRSVERPSGKAVASLRALRGAGERDPGDQERQRDDASRPVDVDHAMEQLTGDEA